MRSGYENGSPPCSIKTLGQIGMGRNRRIYNGGRAVGGRLPAVASPQLHEELCRQLEQWFPGLLDPSTMDYIATQVLRQQALVVPGNATGNGLKSLKSDAFCLAVIWLKDHGGVQPGTQDYDDQLAKSIFNGEFSSAELRRGVRTLKHRHRLIDFLIVTQYLDMTPVAQIAYRLRSRAPQLTRREVDHALLDFWSLLHEQRERPHVAPGHRAGDRSG